MKRWSNKARGMPERAKILADKAMDYSKEKVAEIDREKVQAYAAATKEHIKSSVDGLGDAYSNARKSQIAAAVAQKYASLTKSSQDLVDKVTNSYREESEADGTLSEEERLQRSIAALDGKDRIGLLGESLGVAIGAIGGAAASGAIATAAGATTILGSTALASALGGVFVTATPVGWVIGPVLVLGAAGYGAARMIRSGSEQDIVRVELISSLEHRLESMRNQKDGNKEELNELNQITAICIAGGIIDDSALNRMLSLVEEGKLPCLLAVKRLEGMALEAGLIELASS